MDKRILGGGITDDARSKGSKDVGGNRNRNSLAVVSTKDWRFFDYYPSALWFIHWAMQNRKRIFIIPLLLLHCCSLFHFTTFLFLGIGSAGGMWCTQSVTCLMSLLNVRSKSWYVYSQLSSLTTFNPSPGLISFKTVSRTIRLNVSRKSFRPTEPGLVLSCLGIENCTVLLRTKIPLQNEMWWVFPWTEGWALHCFVWVLFC